MPGGTAYFKSKQKNSLNSVINGDMDKDWAPDAAYLME